MNDYWRRRKIPSHLAEPNPHLEPPEPHGLLCRAAFKDRTVAREHNVWGRDRKLRAKAKRKRRHHA